MATTPTRVIVIGAGWAGLSAASTYLQIAASLDRHIELTVLDDSTGPGGVWSAPRLYPGLVANVPNGLYEFSDLSMVDERHARYDQISGEQVGDYLARYAKERVGMERFRFGAQVVRVRRRRAGEVNSGWVVELQAGEVLECDKLVVATGLYSTPKVPDVPDDGYAGHAIHSKFLGRRHEDICADPRVQEVVVVGGCKSAVEAAAIFVAAGKKVHWVVRPSGQGVPIVVLDPDRWPNLIAASQARLFSIFSPSILVTTGFWYRFLHSGRWALGAWAERTFWRGMTRVVKAGARYRDSANGTKLEPTGDNFFWDVPYVSALYRSSPFLRWMHDAEKVEVHRDRPRRLAGRHMEFESGQTVPADAVVWCTGWRPSVDFFDVAEARRLGVPVPIDEDDEEEQMWRRLRVEHERQVTTLLPRLSEGARPAQEAPRTTPPRMYRQVLSPQLLAAGDRSVAFNGMLSNGQTPVCAELLGLWAVAWMEDLLPPAALPDEAAMVQEVARLGAWMERRYGGRAAVEASIVMEVQHFFDLVMRDLGLRVQRKRRGWLGLLREWLVPYEARDYRGVVAEFTHQVTRRRGTTSSAGQRLSALDVRYPRTTRKTTRSPGP